MTEKVSLAESRRIIKEEPERLTRSPEIQEEAFYRLRNYPKQISENMHSALVTIPRKIAFLLHQKPAYISAAVEAFYLRDPIALRPLRSKDTERLMFKPEDLVMVSVRFTRVGYAQLKSQDFPAPKSWMEKLPQKEGRKAYERAELGMKISCGFEMLLSDPQSQDKPSVREIRLVLEDLDTGDESLPTDNEIGKWDKREDDEKWLDISFEDLDRELKGKGKEQGKEDKSGGTFGDANAQENLQRLVARFEEFLGDNSAGLEGADFIDDFGSDSEVEDDDDELSSEDENNNAPINEEELSRMMKEMMGKSSMPGLQGPSKSSSSRNRVEELDDDSEEDDTEQIKQLSNQMEAELKGTGVLDLNRPGQKKPAGKQLSSKEPGDSQTGDGKGEDTEQVANEDEDPNIVFARNLLESLQGQAGTAGPAGNMLSMMGLPIPKADRED